MVGPMESRWARPMLCITASVWLAYLLQFVLVGVDAHQICVHPDDGWAMAFRGFPFRFYVVSAVSSPGPGYAYFPLLAANVAIGSLPLGLLLYLALGRTLAAGRVVALAVAVVVLMLGLLVTGWLTTLAVTGGPPGYAVRLTHTATVEASLNGDDCRDVFGPSFSPREVSVGN